VLWRLRQLVERLLHESRTSLQKCYNGMFTFQVIACTQRLIAVLNLSGFQCPYQFETSLNAGAGFNIGVSFGNSHKPAERAL